MELRPLEQQTLELLAQGHTTRSAAKEAHCAEETMKGRVSRLLLVLHVSSRTAAVSEGYLRGLLPSPADEKLTEQSRQLRATVQGLRKKTSVLEAQLEAAKQETLAALAEASRLRAQNRNLGSMVPWPETGQGRL